MSKTVAFFGKVDSRLARLAGYVLVGVQDHLHRKRRMSADLDGDVAPVRIKNMNPTGASMTGIPWALA